MKNKDKKLLLNIVLLSAVALSIAQFFFPVFSVNTYDLPNEGQNNYKQECYIFLSRTISFNDDGSVRGFYNNLLYIDLDNAFSKKLDIDDESNSHQVSNFIIPFFILLLSITALYVTFFYFSYKSIKFCGIKKTRYLLYAGLTLVISFIGFFSSSLLILRLYGWDISYIKVDLSFYYIILAIILFFVGYFIQNYFIDYDIDKSNVEKMLFEKYKM